MASATSDIVKEAVFDARVVQANPIKYAVERGGTAVTASPYNALSQTPAQHSYQINVPSQNVWIDRAMDWESTVSLRMNVAIGAGSEAQPGAGENVPVITFGRDMALAPFPLHSLVSIAQATINDTTVTLNTGDVLYEIMRLCDYKKHRLSRTCPTMLDRFARYSDSANGVYGVLNDYLSATEPAEQPNGAFFNIRYADPNTGAVLSGNNSYAFGGVTVNFVNGVPVRTQAPTAEPAQYPIGIQFTSTEKLVLSPFIFANACEWEAGLFGVNNMQFVFTLKGDISRVIRNSTFNGRTVSAVQFIGDGFAGSRILVQFISPPLDLPLPTINTVPFMDFPRYPQQVQSQLNSNERTRVQSQNIVLPAVPDFLIIYCKKNSLTSQEGDFYLPITNISINWDNMAGLLSAQTASQLYQLSVHNGLEMDFNAWNGLAVSSSYNNGVPAVTAGGQSEYVQSVGGFLVIKPGQDYGLQAGIAPGIIGNFSLQYTAEVYNPGALIPSNGATLFTIAVFSGFFQTLAGSSRVIRGPLSEADVISAPMAEYQTRDSLNRIVGGGFMDKLGSFLSKAKSAYTTAKPALSAIKEMLPRDGTAGKIRDAMGMVGLGVHSAGGAMMHHEGGQRGRAGGKKSLSERLM